MSTEIAVLQAQLELQTAAFTAGVKQVDRRLKGMDSNFKKTNRSVLNMEKGLAKMKGGLAGIAASMAAAFSVQSVKNAIAFGDSLAKTADKVGLTVESLQELRFAAEQSGVASNTLDMAIQRFARRSGEARNGTGELTKVYQQLGISLSDSNGNFKDTSQLLGEYADALSKVKDPQERLRLAFKGFDSEGAALVNMLKDGKAGLEGFADQAHQAGLVLSEDTARKAEILQNKIGVLTTQIGVKFKGAVITATASLLEFFDVFTDEGRLRASIKETQAELQKAAEQYALVFERQGGRNMDAYQSKIDFLTNKLTDLTGQMKQFGTDSADALNAAGDAADASGSSYDALKNKIENTLDPMKRYRDEVAEIQKAVSEGHIGAEVAGEYIAQLAIKIAEAEPDVISFAEEMESLGASMRAAADLGADSANRIGSSWAELASGDFDFDGLVDLTGMDAELSSLTNTINAQTEAFGLNHDAIMRSIESFETSAPQIQSISEGMLGAFTDSFDAFAEGVASGTANIKDLFKNMVSSLIAQFLRLMAYKGIMSLLGGPGTALGGAFGSQSGLLSPSAKGNIFNHGKIQAFATGGVVGSPTTFPMSNGKTGLMGEAGPEAIMPLRRGPGGSLGVEAVQPVVNVTNNAPVSVQTRSSANGTVDIEIVERAIESAIRRGGNGIANSIESVYGVNRGSGAFGY